MPARRISPARRTSPTSPTRTSRPISSSAPIPRASSSSAGGTSMAARVSSTPCAIPVTDRFFVTYKAGEPKPDIKRTLRRQARNQPRPSGDSAEMTAEPIASRDAGRLTPARTARFTFDGRSYTALEGDTLASALIANGVHLVGRSFKYHRPRGFLSAGAEEPNALVGDPPRPRAASPTCAPPCRSSTTG